MGARIKGIAELVSVIAVVLSLVFVGLEVRETARQTALNTESVQVTAYQNLISQIAEFNRLLLQPDVAILYNRMQDDNTDWSQFSVVERRQARAILFILFRHADMAFYQYERGMLPEARLESALGPVCVQPPVCRSFWEERKSNFVPEFQAYIDARIAGEQR